MKKRIIYDKYEDPEKEEIVWCYYKKVQEFTWRFYIRIVQDGDGWFTPCDQCQEKITAIWNAEFSLLVRREQNKIVNFAFKALCKTCQDKVLKKLKECPVIIGNVKYEPWAELNRAWVDDDDSIEEVTKEEYNKHKHPAFRV